MNVRKALIVFMLILIPISIAFAVSDGNTHSACGWLVAFMCESSYALEVWKKL